MSGSTPAEQSEEKAADPKKEAIREYFDQLRVAVNTSTTPAAQSEKASALNESAEELRRKQEQIEQEHKEASSRWDKLRARIFKAKTVHNKVEALDGWNGLVEVGKEAESAAKSNEQGPNDLTGFNKKMDNVELRLVPIEAQVKEIEQSKKREEADQKLAHSQEIIMQADETIHAAEEELKAAAKKISKAENNVESCRQIYKQAIGSAEHLRKSWRKSGHENKGKTLIAAETKETDANQALEKAKQDLQNEKDEVEKTQQNKKDAETARAKAETERNKAICMILRIDFRTQLNEFDARLEAVKCEDRIETIVPKAEEFDPNASPEALEQDIEKRKTYLREEVRKRVADVEHQMRFQALSPRAAALRNNDFRNEKATKEIEELLISASELPPFEKLRLLEEEVEPRLHAAERAVGEFQGTFDDLNARLELLRKHDCWDAAGVGVEDVANAMKRTMRLAPNDSIAAGIESLNGVENQLQTAERTAANQQKHRLRYQTLHSELVTQIKDFSTRGKSHGSYKQAVERKCSLKWAEETVTRDRDYVLAVAY